MLALYRFPGATCAAKVLIALHEKGVSFEDRLLQREQLREPWYRKLNPAGVVPTIIHNEEVITESGVILHYINDAFDGPSLSPTNALARARMLHWMKFLDDAINRLMTMTYSIYLREQHLQLSADELQAYYDAEPDPARKMLRRNVVEFGLDAPEVPEAMAVLVGMQQRIDQLAKDKAYLVGDYSLADISITPFMSRVDDLTLMLPKANFPHLHRWWSDIQARASFEPGITAAMPKPVSDGLRAAGLRQADKINELIERAYTTA